MVHPAGACLSGPSSECWRPSILFRWTFREGECYLALMADMPLQHCMPNSDVPELADWEVWGEGGQRTCSNCRGDPTSQPPWEDIWQLAGESLTIENGPSEEWCGYHPGHGTQFPLVFALCGWHGSAGSLLPRSIAGRIRAEYKADKEQLQVHLMLKVGTPSTDGPVWLQPLPIMVCLLFRKVQNSVKCTLFLLAENISILFHMRIKHRKFQEICV